MQSYTVRTQSSHLALSTLNKENNKTIIFKTIIDNNSKKSSRCKTRQSVSKNKCG